jgi:hypothetical protein
MNSLPIAAAAIKRRWEAIRLTVVRRSEFPVSRGRRLGMQCLLAGNNPLVPMHNNRKGLLPLHLCQGRCVHFERFFNILLDLNATFILYILSILALLRSVRISIGEPGRDFQS